MNSIVRHVAEILGIKTNEELEDLYRFALERDQHPSCNVFLWSFCCRCLVLSACVVPCSVQRSLEEKSEGAGRLVAAGHHLKRQDCPGTFLLMAPFHTYHCHRWHHYCHRCQQVSFLYHISISSLRPTYR